MYYFSSHLDRGTEHSGFFEMCYWVFFWKIHSGTLNKQFENLYLNNNTKMCYWVFFWKILALSYTADQQHQSHTNLT